jgi:hypothetical protein
LSEQFLGELYITKMAPASKELARSISLQQFRQKSRTAAGKPGVCAAIFASRANKANPKGNRLLALLRLKAA